MIKSTEGGQEYAKRALQSAAFQTSSFPLRSVIKLPGTRFAKPLFSRGEESLACFIQTSQEDP